MDHTEAVQEMTAERYLLEELTPDARDAFEEHMFDCPKCALDVRSGAAFIAEAKVQLPAIAMEEAAPKQGSWQAGKPTRLSRWWRPVFAVPAFAALLSVVVYQNLVTMPALHTAADSPHVVPVAPLYGAVRSGSRAIIKADRAQGVALPVDLSTDSDQGKFVSYSFELDDSQGKAAWTGDYEIVVPEFGQQFASVNRSARWAPEVWYLFFGRIGREREWRPLRVGTLCL